MNYAITLEDPTDRDGVRELVQRHVDLVKEAQARGGNAMQVSLDYGDAVESFAAALPPTIGARFEQLVLEEIGALQGVLDREAADKTATTLAWAPWVSAALFVIITLLLMFIWRL